MMRIPVSTNGAPESNDDERHDARIGGVVQEAFHLASSAAVAWRAMIAAIEFQYVDEYSEQHVQDCKDTRLW